MIRNEGLLLLRELTASNHELGKIVVFSGALEMLFDIIREEGNAEGGIVVADCLQVVANLLRGTPINISHFRYGVYCIFPALFSWEPLIGRTFSPFSSSLIAS